MAVVLEYNLAYIKFITNEGTGNSVLDAKSIRNSCFSFRLLRAFCQK